MIPIKVSAETTTRFSRSAFREASTEGWEKAGEFWHGSILEKHFTAAAAFEYGYAPRTFAYNKQKLAKLGALTPIVFKGDLKRQVMRIRDVRAISARGASDDGAAVVNLSGPKYLHYKPSPRQPNLALELSTISPRDAQALAGVLETHFDEALSEDGPPEKLGA